MTRHILPGPPAIEIALRRSARARRYSLRIPSAGGPPVLTVPRAASATEALAFAESRHGWLMRHMTARPQHITVGHGTDLPFAGITLRIAAGTGRTPRKDGSALHVPGPAETAGKRVAGWLKAQAREHLQDLCTRHAARLGRPFSKLDLRDPKGRWGSCSSAGRLMFSWRLVMAPPAVLDYVAAHEVAHLAEMNHGPRFWATVHDLCPGHDPHRDWLRRHGADLHRYRFEGAAG